MDFPPESSVILIDDVTTTGATLAESRRALQVAGIKKIIAFTIAH
jgi:predicted amidophosphoribosyltransferase